MGTALGAAIGTGEVESLWLVVLGHLAYAPALFLILAVAALMFGLMPRAIPAAWVFVFYGLVMGFFAPLLNLPQWAMDLLPLDHISRIPGEGLAWLPIITLTILAGWWQLRVWQPFGDATSPLLERRLPNIVRPHWATTAIGHRCHSPTR